MSPELIGCLVAAVLVVAVAAFLVVRLTGGGATRRRELEEQLADAHADNSRVAAEVSDLLEQLAASPAQHAAYRLNVVNNLSGMSHPMSDLTV